MNLERKIEIAEMAKWVCMWGFMVTVCVHLWIAASYSGDHEARIEALEGASPMVPSTEGPRLPEGVEAAPSSYSSLHDLYLSRPDFVTRHNHGETACVQYAEPFEFHHEWDKEEMRWRQVASTRED